MHCPKRKDIRLTHTHRPPDTDGTQLARLDVTPNGDGVHAQPLGDFVYGEESIFGSHRVLIIA